VAIDAARALAIREPQLTARRALLRGLRLAAQRRAVVIAAFSATSWLALALLASAVPLATPLFAFARAFVTVAALLAAAAL
jgi:hypothetical protein